ncbi:NAD-dependent epimerase/dehydratase family protein [Nevskia soli]|uniref:NAD-dependent epimerase/dehydratase family protein n=1 Tax=Nevskia soli TaxID=418856 RepID=UPI001B80B25B|nr:NAD(P)-dependent oxidoreductase [Nevskia soli]
MIKKRILILGASGYVGRQLVKALATSEWAMPLVTHHYHTPPSGCESVGKVDATDSAQLFEAMRGVDAVVNAVAGTSNVIRANARALYEAAARQPQPPRVVYLSSMAVYGAASGVVDESSSLTQNAGGYAGAKVEAERIARGYPRAVILRPGCIYGRGSRQWSERIARWLLAGRIGDLGSRGAGFCNLVHIDDLVAALLNALRQPDIEGECFNIVMPGSLTWNEYFLWLAQFHNALPVRRISEKRLLFEGSVLAPALKAAQLVARLLGADSAAVPEPMPPSLLRLFSQNIRLDGRKSEDRLGLHFTPLMTGLRTLK